MTPNQGGELLARLHQLGLHASAPLERASVLLLLPRPAEYPVEDLLDGTQGDPIVIGTDQEVEPDERPIERSSSSAVARSSRCATLLLIVGVFWTVLWKKPNLLGARPHASLPGDACLGASS